MFQRIEERIAFIAVKYTFDDFFPDGKQNLFGAFEVQVKGRPVDVGIFAQVDDFNVGQSLFGQHAQERVLYRFDGFSAAFVFFSHISLRLQHYNR